MKLRTLLCESTTPPILKLTPSHEDSAVGAALAAASHIRYFNKEIKPKLKDMEQWERKEYTTGFDDTVEELSKLKSLMRDNEALFNNMLSHYDLSVSIFIAKYLNI